MLEFKIVGKDIGEIRSQIKAISLVLDGPAENADVKPVQAPAPAVPATKTTKKAAKKAAKKPAAAEAPAPTPETAPEAKEVNPQDVLSALQKVNNEKGIAVAKGVLDQFGAKRYSDIQVVDYAKFIKACEEAL